VVFASDNGPVTEAWRTWWEVNAHGSTGGLRGRKHGLYEGGIKVPAMIRYPGEITPGSASVEVVTGTDLFVTLLHLAGAKPPTDRPLDGIDASDALRQKSVPVRPLFWSLPTDSGLNHAVRNGPWKLLLTDEGEGRELYDLFSDPLELVNLVEKNEREKLALTKLWHEHQRSIEQDSFRPIRD